MMVNAHQTMVATSPEPVHISLRHTADPGAVESAVLIGTIQYPAFVNERLEEGPSYRHNGVIYSRGTIEPGNTIGRHPSGRYIVIDSASEGLSSLHRGHWLDVSPAQAETITRPGARPAGLGPHDHGTATLVAG